jgi:hypothetical protein
VKCGLSLFFNGKNAELLIAESAVMVQIERIEDLQGLLLTHPDPQLISCLNEVIQ